MKVIQKHLEFYDNTTNITNIAIDWGEDYTTGYLLNFTNFKGNYKIKTELGKKQAFDADSNPKR